jgi:hypothetical protein
MADPDPLSSDRSYNLNGFILDNLNLPEHTSADLSNLSNITTTSQQQWPMMNCVHEAAFKC